MLESYWVGPRVVGVRAAVMVTQWVPGSRGLEVRGCVSPSLLLDWDCQSPEVKQLVPYYQPDLHYLAAFLEPRRRKGQFLPVTVSYGAVPRSGITLLTELEMEKVKR